MTASSSSNQVSLTRHCRHWTKKGTLLFMPFLLLLCFFSFPSEGSPDVSVSDDDKAVQGRRRFEAAYDCDIDCGIGETCVPDLSPTFGTLLAHHHSGTVPFRCHVYKEEAAAAPNANVVTKGNDDTVFPEDFFLTSNGCPLDCKNEGKCISIFGGLSFACLCVEPFWGTECELNGNEEPCELDCNSIVGDSFISNDASQPRQGAFCVESPDSSEVVDQTCVHCEEISQKDEPNCDDLNVCKNGGVCKIEYQFVIAVDDNSSGDSEANSEGLFKCSSTTTMTISGTDGSSAMQTVWMDLPPYKLSCDCQPGFQGGTCDEIDVCDTGCQNNGYCISKDTPGNDFGSDDFFNFNTDDSNPNDDTNDSIYDDDFYVDDDDDDDGFDNDFVAVDDNSFHDDDDDFAPPVAGKLDCTCYEGHCDQTSCGAGATCVGGMCIQDKLVSPMCSGGKCSQRHTHHPSCTGGDCDQTAAVEATCGGTDCFRDEIEAQTLIPNTVAPDFQPFCSCKYGYFGDLCQYEITTICLLDESGYNQLLHEVCLQLGGLCPLDVGNRFCANGGTCGNVTNIILPNGLGANLFSCECPIGFEGIHCEIEITEAPSWEPTAKEPITSIGKVSSSPSPQKWYTPAVFVVPCVTILLSF